MRGQTATGITLGGIVAAGAALITHGAVTGADATYKAGVGVLVTALACLVMHRSHCNTNRLIAHQTRLAVMTEKERQEWAAYGYRAGELDAAGRHAVRQPGAVVVDITPHTEHRNGA